MKTQTVIILIIVIFLLLGVSTYFCMVSNCRGWRDSNKNQTYTNTIPQNVLNKYLELEVIYKNSLGAGLEECRKIDELIYNVWGSGGFSGVNFYYDINGTSLGEYHWDDMVEPNEPMPPVNLEGYNCTKIEST